MKTQVFDQTQFKNIPTMVRAKLNNVVDGWMKEQQNIPKKGVILFGVPDPSKCRHEAEHLQYIRNNIRIVKKVVCACGKVWKY